MDLTSGLGLLIKKWKMRKVSILIIANEIIKDFQSVTNYPPDERHMGDGSALAEQVNLVALKITELERRLLRLKTTSQPYLTNPS